MRLLILISSCLLITIACRQNQQNIRANNDFVIFLDEYINYVDSTQSYKKNYDYIYLDATEKHDSIDLIITLIGGSYEFLKYPYRAKIIDFLNYRGYNILLSGDFPNEIIRNKINSALDINKDIVKKYYFDDFLKWQQDSLSVGPMIYDYMAIFLTYKKNKLIDYHKQYY
jgi:hypothetical protein